MKARSTLFGLALLAIAAWMAAQSPWARAAAVTNFVVACQAYTGTNTTAVLSAVNFRLLRVEIVNDCHVAINGAATTNSPLWVAGTIERFDSLDGVNAFHAIGTNGGGAASIKINAITLP